MTITTIGTAVRLRAVTRIFGTGESAVTALDAVDVEIPPATFTAVMGPSGSGKSTLLHCAAGLDRATSGEVAIDGVSLTGLSERALTKVRRERVGFVFQAFNLIPALTAEQNVGLPLRLARRRPAPGQVEQMLAEVGLADRARHRPSELSGGQQQRVAIARALVSRPAVLFADEPTGALDTTASREVLRLLRTAVDRHAQTIVMVTHDPYAAAHADRVLFLADGRVVDALDNPSGASEIAVRMARLEER
ncbi:ABC transporter ATP-binding protein [Actinoplanes friuliensis]|jgi:putative ABC transport system ATP-binding protein|uniref:Putative ABC transporter ATP-binding protein n=1 Tax=Actinoplanes friuliensis DSM 7358 TaxID=1246995 RepID=U5W2P6_9ACTN|nr:ABC transporter ATP-binding protein [Actinoplanes friuliensis]AGZ43503.1 putative ABC transporter ATP-binding protein [Actinoplanes friuliensis DSM 7358]